MVGHHGQVAVPLAVRDLVHSDPVDLIQSSVVDVLGDHAGDDAGDRFPRTAQQPGDRGLVHPLRQPGQDVFEVAREPGTGPRPRNRLGAYSPAAAAVQASDLGA